VIPVVIPNPSLRQNCIVSRIKFLKFLQHLCIVSYNLMLCPEQTGAIWNEINGSKRETSAKNGCVWRMTCLLNELRSTLLSQCPTLHTTLPLTWDVANTNLHASTLLLQPRGYKTQIKIITQRAGRRRSRGSILSTRRGLLSWPLPFSPELRWWNYTSTGPIASWCSN
jgi:hypothetical protein